MKDRIQPIGNTGRGSVAFAVRFPQARSRSDGVAERASPGGPGAGGCPAGLSEGKHAPLAAPHLGRRAPEMRPVRSPESLYRIFLALMITTRRWTRSTRPPTTERINKVQAVHMVACQPPGARGAALRSHVARLPGSQTDAGVCGRGRLSIESSRTGTAESCCQKPRRW